MALNARRNAAILSFYKANDWSYQLVADKFNVSRCVVAGLVFRDFNPPSERIRSPNGGRNKIGGGYHGCPYWPTYTVQNSDARSARRVSTAA
jgi:hypothetical protein